MNNKKNNAPELMKHLEQEISWIEELNIILAQEKTILETRQFELLDELANLKQEISNKLEGSAQARLDLVQDTLDGSISADFLKNFSEKEAKQINELNSLLAEKLTTCRELNTVNGQVIANNLYTRQEIVNALSGNNTEAVNVYTSTGSVSVTSDSSHHQEA